MKTLNIVMVEPQIPQNTGNVARTCAATGARLHLVGPMGFAVDDKKLKRAGLDYWHLLDISYYDSLDTFFSKTPWQTRTAYFFLPKPPASIPKSPTGTAAIYFWKRNRRPAEDLLIRPRTRACASPCSKKPAA